MENIPARVEIQVACTRWRAPSFLIIGEGVIRIAEATPLCRRNCRRDRRHYWQVVTREGAEMVIYYEVESDTWYEDMQ